MSEATVPAPEGTTAPTGELWIPHLPTDTFGERLRYVRVSLDLTVAEAARRCGYSSATWSTWENGTSQNPRGLDKIVSRVVETLSPDGKRLNRNWLMWGSTMDRYTNTTGEGVQVRLFEPSAASDVQARRHLQPVT